MLVVELQIAGLRPLDLPCFYPDGGSKLIFEKLSASKSALDHKIAEHDYLYFVPRRILAYV